MTADPFRRLALLVGATGWVVAIAVVWLYLAWWAALAGLVLGPLVTVLLTLEQQHQPPAAAAEPEGLSRLEIGRRARRAEP